MTLTAVVVPQIIFELHRMLFKKIQWYQNWCWKW